MSVRRFGVRHVLPGRSAAHEKRDGMNDQRQEAARRKPNARACVAVQSVGSVVKI
jgi:hypothetical protein